VRTVPRLCELYPGICLKLRKKHGKPSDRVGTVHFGMNLYNEQCNAQVFNLFIYLLPPYMFRAFF
jgi:hypothetical protein